MPPTKSSFGRLDHPETGYTEKKKMRRRGRRDMELSWRPHVSNFTPGSFGLPNVSWYEKEQDRLLPDDIPNGGIVYDDVLAYDELNPMTTPPSHNNSRSGGDEPPRDGIGIRGEEIGIIVGVILLWVGAIALFFNRWGKIRMLEPYQPKFCEEHRLSCPISESSIPPLFPRSFSKLNLLTEENPHYAKFRGSAGGSGSGAVVGGLAMRSFGIPTGVLTSNATNQAPPPRVSTKSQRLRQHSLFTTTLITGQGMSPIQRTNKNGRRTKSAIDLPTLVLSEEFYETMHRNSKNTPVTHV